MQDTKPATAGAGLAVSAMPREFLYNGQKLPDPDPSLSPDRVRSMFAVTYPELATATVEGPTTKDGKMVYTYVKAIGVKG
jgi:PRTRC genetic system protein C